jgi:hypothetical protein
MQSTIKSIPEDPPKVNSPDSKPPLIPSRKRQNPGRLSLNSGGVPLVTTIISGANFHLFKFELFPCSVKILRPGGHVIAKPGKKNVITLFSWASKRRLRFTAANAFPPLISQFVMEYHRRNPGGRAVKKNLYCFLKAVRKEYPGIGYLWILEFQKRGVVHFHIYFTLTVSKEFHKFLAVTWHEIAEPESFKHLKVHLHSKQFIAWDMKTAGYLTKYLDKDCQKKVPEGFDGVGRFWGASMGLVKAGVIVSDLSIDDTFPYISPKPSKTILRTICKLQESKSKKKTKWTNWGRRSRTNYTLLEGRSAYDQMIEFHNKQSPF